MAAEVPAKDVLCEAMEYLSKLGSNLRTRSENLKEKKIRREKLNNVLAVQKAANKVLLICELSKKTLENVVSGVRKVLEHIDTSQASSSDGGKKLQIEKVDANTPKYYYFEYKTRKLRIKNRISFKHYNSVKVYAKMLPKSMLDKYPIHYDCKLYRMRRKIIESQEINKESKKDDADGNLTPNDVSIVSIPDTPISKPQADNEIKIDLTNNDMSIISIPDSPKPKLDDSKKNSSRLSAEKEIKRKSSVESTKDKNVNSDRDRSPSKKSDKCGRHENREKRGSSDHSQDKKKTSKRKRVISDSSSDDEKKAEIDSEKIENVLSTKGDDSDVSCQKSDSKKQKLNEESNNDDTENDTVKPVIKCVSLSKLLKPDILEKEKIKGPHSKPRGSSIKDKQKEEAKINETQAKEAKEEAEYWAQKRKEVSTFSPKNLVIYVTRLPELSTIYLNKLCLKKITQDGSTICEIIDENDEADTDQTHKAEAKKRNKESNESKSNSRRASLSSSFDNDDALIAEANKVKNSLLNESDSEDMIGSDNEGRSSKKDTETIKNALLKDSDSETKKSEDGSELGAQDKADQRSVSDTEQAKNALCEESDPDSEKNELNLTTAQANKDDIALSNKSDVETSSMRLIFDPDSDTEHTNTSENVTTPAKKLADRSNSEDGVDSGDKNINENNSVNSSKKNEESLSECQKNERTPEKISSNEAKSSLLNESSDDKTKTPLSQRLTPQSKKKRMRESIHAKKMLLAYSSSDTEDEQLKNVLKDIKDSLLHGSDEENKEKKQSKESSPSSSEDDIIKKVIRSDSSSSKRKRKTKQKKHCRRLDSEDRSNNSDNSKSSSSKMVRSKSKPGNSSSQNSDAADSYDKDIDGLANLNTLNKSRRRNSNSSEMSESSTYEEGKRKSKLNSKSTGLIAEDILEAESSSESAANSAEEIENDEDIPAITLPSINGDGEHLVKEDLLGESDSSASHNDDVKSVKEESGSEDKPNVRRRKTNAISSDSEVGSSRKKDADVRLSDFEESEDSDVNNQRNKRKKKASDSDASVGSSSSNDGGKKKRRRIKSVRDSDASGSESDNEGRNKHGRKNIRKVMGKNQLEEATKKAARQEKERIARIAERQKMYNNLEFDESGKPDEVVLDKVILDFDPETKEPLIEVDRGLVKKLKPHQANGIKFMWDACFESVKRIKKDRGSGCILAHCMGLGKTLQVVSLTHTLLIHSDLTSVQRVLVVCPLSTVLNWVNEFRMWLKFAETEYDVEVYELSRYKQNSERAFQLSQWIRHGGVCVLGYEMFRNLSADNNKKFKKKMLKSFQEALVDPGPDLVVCDEGHLLKNEKTSLSQSMNRVKTYRRIVLTGTPLQNNLKEYYCMVQFVKPNLLGKYNEYLNRFVNPITNGQYTDSTEHDIKIMKRRSHVLHKMLDGAVQRRDYGVLAPFLPPKHEYVLFITLSEVQTKLYQHYLDNFSRRPLPGKSSGFLFPDFQSLQRIWTHPLVLKYNSERYEIMQQKKRDKEEEDLDSEGSIRDFIDDDSTPDESSTEDSTDDSSDMSDDSRKKNKKKKKAAKKSKGKDKEGKGEGGHSRPRRGTRANPVEFVEEDEKDDDIIELKNENPTEWWIKLVIDEELEDMRNSHKLVLLFDILRQCETIGDKLLVFSQSLYSLDLIEHFLGKVDDATQEGRIDEKLGGHIGTWSPGIDYFRLDGSTSCENRSIWCKNFNREDNPRARLFLISTRAGGLGINLVAANRVVIFDVSWNPSHDVQSIFRVYRFGQKKPCYVYRFLAMGTMEEKIYERQVTKQAISKRVIDEQQIDRHYAENDLAELYKFEPQPPSPRPIPPLPKDRLFAEMLREHEVQIYKYHEHDSLLENKEEETLSEEERKAAWEDFENEKNRPPPAPFPNTWQMPNILQQQQLAYAALAAMLRKDMPNLSDNQLRDMLPLIYNSNPQLMQKLSEIYKYSPGMMNPAMMNPGVMNPAGGVGALGGMGGASGLQYEPPWQRQQQQQQQMRLQQLLQHQNQMGAKFYAGGLGSRDPVAMALQQQRAREIMLGNAAGAAAGAGAGGAGRPRGRPPLQPRAPPAGDVVNLDSD